MADPYWEKFCTPLAGRILALVSGAGGEAERAPGAWIMEESVDAVLADGRYQVGGDALRTKGKATLQVGQRVHVLWKQGARALILTHQWQRAQGGTWTLEALGVVEELIIAGAAGARDVWFRNYDQLTPLTLRASGLDRDPIGVKWGQDANTFFVWTATHEYFLYTLARNPAESLPPGQAVAATLLRVEKPGESNLLLLTATYVLTLTGTITAPMYEAVYTTLPGPPPTRVITGFTCATPLTGSSSVVGSNTQRFYLTTAMLDALIAGTGRGAIYEAWLAPKPGLPPSAPPEWELFLLLGFNSTRRNYSFPTTTTRTTWTTGPGADPTPGSTVTSGTSNWSFRDGGDDMFVINVTAGTVVSRSIPETITFDDARFSGVELSVNAYVRGSDDAGNPLTFGASWVPTGGGAPVVTCDVGETEGGLSTSAEAMPRLQFPGLTGYVDREPIEDLTIGGDPGGPGTRKYQTTVGDYLAASFTALPDPPTPTVVRIWYVADCKMLRWDADLSACRFWAHVRRFDDVLDPPVDDEVRIVVFDGHFQVVATLVDYVPRRYGTGSARVFRSRFNSANPQHVLWAQTTGVAPTAPPSGPVVDADYTWALYLAHWPQGPAGVRLVGTDYVAYVDRALRVLGYAPDILYEGREPSPTASGLRPVIGWDAAKLPTLDLTTEPATDTTLEPVTKLQPLPEDFPPRATPTLITSINPSAQEPWRTHQAVDDPRAGDLGQAP